MIDTFEAKVRSTRTQYRPHYVPDEVRERIEWAYSSIGNTIIRHPPSIVVWYHKAREERSTAWWTTLAANPDVEARQWRKEHTEHYWVWVVPQE